jgi:hypothetical protein
MLPRWPGWTRTERGDVVTLVREHRSIAYRERVRPLRAFDEQLAQVLAELPGAVVGDRVALRTVEGEHAELALVTHGAMHAVIGSVLGDDFYASLFAQTTVASEHRDLAAIGFELLAGTRLALGVRRRRLLVAVPGWTGESHGLTTTLSTDQSVIQVLPVEPLAGRGDPIAVIVAATEADGAVIDWIEGPFDLLTQAGFVGATWRLAIDTGTHCDVVVLRDAAYEYTLILESTNELAQARHRDALHALVTTFTPLAPRLTDATVALAAVAHWAL